MDNDVKNMINAIRVSIQDAYNITKVLERLACKFRSTGVPIPLTAA